jgi:hypothetical protein
MHKPKHKIHDWITKIKVYTSTDRRELEMDNIQNHLQQFDEV